MVITIYCVKFLIQGGNYGSTTVVYKVVLEGVGSILVHDTFGTKDGRFWYMSISVQTMSRSVHGNSTYANSVLGQYNFGTQSVHQEYDFGTFGEV